MLRGLYTSASGMLTQQRTQEMRANNMANVDTSGHKRDMAVKRDFPSMFLRRINDTERLGPYGPEMDFRPYIGELGAGVVLEETVKDFSQGTLKETGNSLDLALDGQGFFTVEGPEDAIFFTRSGALTLNQDGTLVTQQGHPVLGDEGEDIQLSGEGEVTVTEDGDIYEGGEYLATLGLVDFDNPQGLSRVGENLLEETDESGEPIAPEGLGVRQGYVEGSNVNIVDEMTGMINALRAYETNQRAIHAHDETLDRSVNETGRPPS